MFSDLPPLKRLWLDLDGATAVEFGFVGFIFILLMLGSMDFARYEFTVESLRDLAGETARVALVNANNGSSSITAPTSLTPFLVSGSVNLTTSCSTDSTSKVTTCTATVTYPFNFIVPLLPTSQLTVSDSSSISY